MYSYHTSATCFISATLTLANDTFPPHIPEVDVEVLAVVVVAEDDDDAKDTPVDDTVDGDELAMGDEDVVEVVLVLVADDDVE